jgi:class 3 adenylate cyclase/tetratricopeptide (TPR) repeat protein
LSGAGATRKLATIVALDVAGYSARTEADEARTTAEVAALRKVIEGIAARHGGRVFNTAGDGFMLEFGSSLSAVEAALELAETCVPKVRVGVHLGDVVVQPNGDLLGHGVNVAARLMARSDPGSALVSGAVRQSIRGPITERLQSRGLLKLDKMAETIEAFALGTAVSAAKDVFLSYARDDQAVARKFAEALERDGLAVWWDVALRSGEAYDVVMEAALKSAKAVVVLWSKKSVDSRWVRAEATQADQNGTLVPVMIEACKRPIMFELTQTAEMSHWNGDPRDKAWLSLVEDVKKLLRDGPHVPKHDGVPAAAKPASAKPKSGGERKQVTVLNCALTGAGDAVLDLDPEDWREIVHAFRSEAVKIIERFEGQATASQDDSVTAFFGAEQTREVDAEQAVRAGFALVDMIRTFKPKGAPQLAVQIGIDTGLVVIGGDGPAFGPPINNSAQLQVQAMPNTVIISPATASLAGGYLELEPLGSRAFRVDALRATRTRFDLSRARGLSRFVGRSADMRVLEDALAQAEAGNGQVVGIAAEAGSGKSRLCFEFLEQCRARGIPVFEGRAVAHGRNVPLLPILEVFRAFFDIRPEDASAAAQEKIQQRLLALDASLTDAVPLVFDFLGVPDPARPLPMVDPTTRQRQIVALMRHIIKRAGDQRTSITLIEDLHWIDPASAEFLEHMVDARAGSRSLMLVNYRPEYHAEWMRNPWCRQITLAPLAGDAVNELLADLLGADKSLAGLPAMIEARTKRNPFFIEEVVRALVETKHLKGLRGAYKLVTPVDKLEVPATVTAVVAARFDRLGEREKRLLQAASVIGKDFSEPLLSAVADLPAHEVGSALANLRRAEFIQEQSLFPVAEYSFKQPLTQEVTLGTMLKERRRQMHAAVARMIESQDAGRLDERAALLAHHWEGAGNVIDAARWHRRAAEWVGLTNLSAASWHWSRLRSLLKGVPADRDTAELGMVACQNLLNLSWRFPVVPDEIQALGEEGMAFARATGSRNAELKVAMVYARARATIGDLAGYAKLAAEARDAAMAIDDATLQANANLYLVDALVYTARFPEALALADASISVAPKTIPPSEWIMGFNPYGALKFWRAACLALMGRLPESIREYDECRTLSAGDGTPEAAAYLASWAALAHLSIGDLPSLIACAEEVDKVCTALGDPPTIVAHRQLCRTYVHLASGQFAEAIKTAGAALEIHKVGERQHAGLSAMLLATAHLLAGDAGAAATIAQQAIEFSRMALRVNLEAQALCVLARALLLRDGEAGFAPAREALDRADEIIERIGAKTLKPTLLECRADLAGAMNNAKQRTGLLEQAAALYDEIGAPLQAARLRQALAA